MDVKVVTLTVEEVEDLIQATVRATVTEIKPNHVPLLMDKSQVADYLGKTKATINRWMKQGLPYRKEGKEYPEFYRPLVDKWMEERFSEYLQNLEGETDNAEGQELGERHLVHL